MPTLTASTPSVDQVLGRLLGGDVAGDEIDVREPVPQSLDHVQDALRVPVRGVDDEDVHVGRNQRGRPFDRVLADADRGADAQAAQLGPWTRSDT